MNWGKNTANAAPLFLKSKEDKEISGDICYIVGNAYFELEDYPNAGNVFKHALEWNEGNGLYYRDYAVTLAKLGQTEEAEKALTLFLTVYDGGYVTFQLQQNIAILYEHLDCFDEAKEILLEMAESYLKRYEVYKRLAYLEADRQQMKEISDRDYRRMQEYYEKAQEQYSGEEQDMEMEMLRNMMQELKESGWL